MKKDLVNILIPAYNAEKYIHRLLDSILRQTYPKIKLIVIDDGSTDGTAKLIESYRSKFEERGYGFEYHYQQNLGRSSALNNGLKYLDGEYLTWPDSDDWYASETAIEKLVNLIKTSPKEIGLSRCAYNRIEEKNYKKIRVSYPQSDTIPIKKFEQATLGDKCFWFEPGGWMIN